MILLDTSFLVGYYRRIDLHHKEAIRMAEAYEGDQAFTISGVFQELLSVMNRKVSAEAAIQIGDLILSENSSVQLLKLDDAVFEVFPFFKFSYDDVEVVGNSFEFPEGSEEARVIKFF